MQIRVCRRKMRWLLNSSRLGTNLIVSNTDHVNREGCSSIGTGGITRLKFPAADLVEMVLHVLHVIFRNPAESGRFELGDLACDLVGACRQITEHMNTNLCRCCGFAKVAKAVQRAADAYQAGGGK